MSSPIPLSFIYSFIPFCQLLRDRPCFPLPSGFYYNIWFGSLASSILYTCPNRISCLSLIYVVYDITIHLRNFFMLMLVTIYILDSPAALHPKSNPPLASHPVVIAQTSKLYVMILFTMVFYIRFLFLLKCSAQQ